MGYVMSDHKIENARNGLATVFGILNPLAVVFPVYGGVILHLHGLCLYALTALKARLR